LALLAAEQQNLFPALRTAFTTAVYPLQQLVSSPIRFGRHIAETFSSQSELLDENRSLKEEQLMLKTKLLKFAAMEQENIRLRGLLETSFKVGEHALIAELLSVTLGNYEHVITVNKGGRFGILPEQPVMDANGIVGQVLRVTPFSADVMLISDPNHAIPVQVNRNGARTIAIGSGQIDKLLLPQVTSNTDIKPGDLLVSSGLGGIFPQGYPVATVTSISPQDDASGKATAKPLAKLDRIREVLMVWSNSTPIPRMPEQSANRPDFVGPPLPPHD
jgi:rod shape-determining protein MreC